MIKINVNFKNFSQIYGFGFGLAFLLGVSISVIGSNIIIYILLAYSLLHLIILSILGFSFEKHDPERMSAATRVQLLGYLYTLLSMIVACVWIGRLGDTWEIPDLLFAVGIALVTSLIGWFFGNLIEDTEKTDLPTEIEKVAEKIKEFQETIVVAQKSYDEATQEIISNQRKLSTELLNNLRESTEQTIEEQRRRYKTISNTLNLSIQNTANQIEILQSELTEKHRQFHEAQIGFLKESDKKGSELMEGLIQTSQRVNQHLSEFETSVVAMNVELVRITTKIQNAGNAAATDLGAGFKTAVSQVRADVNDLSDVMRKLSETTVQEFSQLIKESFIEVAEGVNNEIAQLSATIKDIDSEGKQVATQMAQAAKSLEGFDEIQRLLGETRTMVDQTSQLIKGLTELIEETLEKYS